MMSLGHSSSVSSGTGSPETYHGPSGASHQQKNTYRQIPGHQPMATGSAFPQMIPGSGAPYHPQLSVLPGQFYQPVQGPTAGFMPVCGPGTTPDTNGYYYYGPNSWAMHGPMPVYPHTFTGSPLSNSAQLPYGYPLVSHGHEFPPSIHITGANGQAPTLAVPRLDHRRNSWSSSGATDSPITPYPTNIEPSTNILANGYEPQSAVTDDQANDLSKYVETLLLQGPPVPNPIPGSFMSGPLKTLSQTLENPTNTTNVYIRGLPPDTDDDKLYEMTCRFGNVVSHKAIMDTEHGTCKG